MSDTCRRISPCLRALPVIAGLAAMVIAFAACDDNNTERVADVESPDKTPTMVTTNVATFISDSGYTRFHITAPIWYMFEEARVPRWTFPQGLFLEKYDNNFKQEATLVCDSAIYFSLKKLWRLDGNVRMKNVKGDRFLTNQLFWDQEAHKVYSDSFIHIERADRVIEGHGFTSNETMTDYTINNPTGIFPVNDFKPGGGDAAATNDSTRSATAPRHAPAATPAPAPAPAPAAKPATPAAPAKAAPAMQQSPFKDVPSRPSRPSPPSVGLRSSLRRLQHGTNH